MNAKGNVANLNRVDDAGSVGYGECADELIRGCSEVVEVEDAGSSNFGDVGQGAVDGVGEVELRGRVERDGENAARREEGVDEEKGSAVKGWCSDEVGDDEGVDDFESGGDLRADDARGGAVDAARERVLALAPVRFARAIAGELGGEGREGAFGARVVCCARTYEQVTQAS